MDADELKDKTPTFVVTVQYRQNASWQGTVKWLEGEKEARFESALEFIKLVDSLAQKEGETGWK
ncbi:MAG TPA: hypothetical protein DEB31_09965 [Clostridiales bacterium]|nr:hypothetical protein [Clostridiales bacterium]